MVIEALTWLVISALPANRIPMVAMRDLATARDRWLLTVLTLGSIWLAHAGMLAQDQGVARTARALAALALASTVLASLLLFRRMATRRPGAGRGAATA